MRRATGPMNSGRRPDHCTRRIVLVLTRNRCAISASGCRSSSRMRRASAFRAGERAGGLAPTRPRLRAAAGPSRVRPEIRSRANRAMDAMTWNTSRPAGGGVDVLGQRPEARAALLDQRDDVEEIAQGARQPVIPGDNHHIARTQRVDQPVKLGPPVFSENTRSAPPPARDRAGYRGSGRRSRRGHRCDLDHHVAVNPDC